MLSFLKPAALSACKIPSVIPAATPLFESSWVPINGAIFGCCLTCWRKRWNISRSQSPQSPVGSGGGSTASFNTYPTTPASKVLITPPLTITEAEVNELLYLLALSVKDLEAEFTRAGLASFD